MNCRPFVTEPAGIYLPRGRSLPGTGNLPETAAEPDPGAPEQGEYRAEEVHNGHHRTRGEHQDLQQATARQHQPERSPGGQHGEQHRGRHQDAAGQRGRAPGRVLHGQRDRDGEPDHDRRHDQHGGAQPSHRAPPPGPPASSSRASPAVITEPVISTPVLPSPPSASEMASSASPTAISIASSIRSACRTRSGPSTVPASSRSLAGAIDRLEELAVTTSSVTTGSSWSRIAGTSLSSLTARMPIRPVKLNASVSASRLAAIPAGLCAESTMTVGLRRTTSSRPGEDICRNASLTRSSSSACASSGSPPAGPVNASAAARAQAALPAWYAPNSGRNRSW